MEVASSDQSGGDLQSTPTSSGNTASMKNEPIPSTHASQLTTATNNNSSANSDNNINNSNNNSNNNNSTHTRANSNHIMISASTIPASADAMTVPANTDTKDTTPSTQANSTASKASKTAKTASSSTGDGNTKSAAGAPKRKKKKVDMACVYCRRSHMICDDSRPCQRCIKRGIGHLCYDEPSNSRQRQKAASMSKKTSTDLGSMAPTGIARDFSPQSTSPSTGMNTPTQLTRVATSQHAFFQDNLFQQQHQQRFVQPNSQQQQRQLQQKPNSVLSQTLTFNQEPFFYSEHAGSEFSSLNDFLSMIDDPELVNGSLTESGSIGGGNAAADPLLQFGMGSRMNTVNNTNGGVSSVNGVESGTGGLISNENSNSLTNILAFSPGAPVFSEPLLVMNMPIELQFLPQQLLQQQIQMQLQQELIQFLQQIQQQQQQQQQIQQQQQQIQQQQQQQQQRQQQQQQQRQQQQQQQQQIQQQQQQIEHHQQQIHQELQQSQQQSPPHSSLYSYSKPVLKPTHQPVISDSARDKFFLTAADPTTEISPEERLKQVIKAKLEAGLLQPYNYAKGYARLQSYMDNYMNVSSRQRILKPLSIFRPAFRAIARTLKDVDLVLVEESFERMLLDYDRVFTSMAIPACLWRRTGEIYRGNKEFASLVGVSTDDLKDGKLAIYELMSEESAVNFWEKYGAIAFDKGQKAVLTSCNLRTKDGIKRKSCCFSFTIRRDRYNIPSCIVGNFIPIDPIN